jgi:hypothetical protein
MTIFVDDFRVPARVGRISGRWSHMLCGPFDDLAELHEMAARIGMQRRWFQGKPWPRAHYDVTDSVRAKAIAAGAVPITWRATGLLTASATRAWRATAGEMPPARTPEGKPPGRDDLWRAAAALYAADWGGAVEQVAGGEMP